MSSPGRLKGGIPRLLGRHDGATGRAYRAFYGALVKDLGPFDAGSLLAYQAGQVAVAWLSFVAATEAITEARRKRDTDRGRRPSARGIDRLQHRQQVANRDYSEALASLREAVKARPPKPYAQVLAERRAQAAQERPQ
jgi:hypothetical protein